MAAPAPPPPAPPAPPAQPLQQLPPPFLQTLIKNTHVSAACIAGATQVLQDTLLARQAEFFSGRVSEGLNLLLPSVLKDIAFAKDKRKGLGEFVYQAPLWSLGVPDSCGYIGLHYCQIDAVPVFAKWGVCVPQECSAQDVMAAIFPPVTQKLAEHIKARCGPMTADKALFFAVAPLTAGAWATLMLLLVLTIVVLASTLVDVYGEEWNLAFLKHDGVFRDMTHCFSLVRNYQRLMAPPRGGPFASFDAIRTLGMLMIILGHTMYFTLTVSGVTNPREALGFYGRGFLATMPGLIADGCLLGVDTFLVLAGFLAVYLFLKELEKRLGPTSQKQERMDDNDDGYPPRRKQCGTNTLLVTKMALVSYLRRYLRLTPAYAVILAIFTTLAPLMSSAPPSPTDLTHEIQQCQTKWWRNLLYINNDDPYTMCYNPSWFLAVVQQLFLLVPWLSVLAFVRPKLGLAASAALCLSSYIYTFQHAQAEGWRINSIDRPGFPTFFSHFYAKTFTRMPTFLIGGIAAMLYHQYGDRFHSFVTKGKSPQVKVWGLLGLALAILAAVMFGPYRELAYAPGKWNLRTSSIYITLSFSGWAIGLCIMCGVLAMGRGGLLKTFLELPFWSITSRLTYSTYLCHPMVILTVISSAGGHPFHFSMLNLFNEFLGYAALSGLSAVVFYFLVESPAGELERLLFSRLLKKPSPKEMEEKEDATNNKEEVDAAVVIVSEIEGELGSPADVRGSSSSSSQDAMAQ